MPDTGHTLLGNHNTTDVVLEQLPPVTAWGNSAVLVPCPTTQAPDVARILSADDGNVITINGIPTVTLGKGKVYEIAAVTEPMVISSTLPMLVGQYLHSTTMKDSVAYGDPAFTLVFPAEQYDTAYTVMNVDDKVYVGSFLKLALPIEAIGKIYLDGSLIPLSEYSPVGTTGFALCGLTVSRGVHNLHSPIGFGVTV